VRAIWAGWQPPSRCEEEDGSVDVQRRGDQFGALGGGAWAASVDEVGDEGAVHSGDLGKVGERTAGPVHEGAQECR